MTMAVTMISGRDMKMFLMLKILSQRSTCLQVNHFLISLPVSQESEESCKLKREIEFTNSIHLTAV